MSIRTLKRLSMTLRGMVSGWAVAGIIIAITGFAPQVWIARFVHQIASPADVRRLLPLALDVRVEIVLAGITIIVWDVLYRSRQRYTAHSGPGATRLIADSQRSPGDWCASRAPRLSIVVLPFANVGGDPEQEYFADGVTEILTTDLSRIPGAFVIAHNSALAYKGKPVDARQIGRELGVRYVMEGCVQSIGSRVRVNAQIVDAGTGAHLWAERFDKQRADVFEMQDEITARLARMVGIELVAAEGRRAERERPDNMDAMDLAMRGWAIINQPSSLDDARRARADFEAALRLDDGNVDALVGLAESYELERRSFVSLDVSEQIRVADAATAKALMRAPNNALAHYARATVLLRLRAPERALRELELAIGLDQNLALAHAYSGFMKLLLGRPAETKAHVAEAIRLSPRDPQLSHWHFYIGAADLYQGRAADAVEALHKAVELHPHHNLNHFFLAAALAVAGREAEAAEACAVGQRIDPTFSVAKFRDLAPSNNAVFLALRERVYDGMRKAGVPEG
ncbi:adenylate cyclase [Trinickia violacea]|uniref:Adenylate cyclase n=1 Tax=Trinickia violacea TaxID=2571746 RepID=A0A4P8IZP5_9BURK|nr:tetratricopeptide repeat protein [Trinickia violacea]QCP53073.1 adenylate cyclase [Trinickia violacea]